MASNTIRVTKEVFEWIRDEQYRLRKLRDGDEPTQGGVVASLIAAYESINQPSLTKILPDINEDLAPWETEWVRILIMILRSGNADALMAVTSNLKVFAAFIQQPRIMGP